VTATDGLAVEVAFAQAPSSRNCQFFASSIFHLLCRVAPGCERGAATLNSRDLGNKLAPECAGEARNIVGIFDWLDETATTADDLSRIVLEQALVSG
jgi:hypothetical protein